MDTKIKELKPTAAAPATEPGAAEANKDNPNYVKFKEPYAFEGKTYEGIDLSPLGKGSISDLCKTQRMFNNSGAVSALQENDYEFICDYMSIVMEVPIEFFKGLPAVDGFKIRSLVANNFLGMGE
jgi:hypothetical protein